MKRIKFVDLFAGLGGFHVAAEQLGGACVFAAEIQPHLRELYEENFGLTPAGDIRTVKIEDIPEHDLLCAGFPCQPFSKAGEQLGFECTKQGDLFFVVTKILKAKQPDFFILENVPNILKHNGGETYAQIRKNLEAIGYSVLAECFSPHQFGIPQIRERAYIVGALQGLKNFRWPAISHAETSIKKILDVKPEHGQPLSNQIIDCLKVWDGFLAASKPAAELPSFPIWSMEFGATYPFEEETPFAVLSRKGTRGLAKYRGSHGIVLSALPPDDRLGALPSHARTQQLDFPKWKKNFIRQNRAFYEANKKWIAPWLPQILHFPSSLQKFEWNAKGGERVLWNYIIQFRASGVRVKRPTTAPSLVAMTDTQVPIIGWERRYMTPRECARLQSLSNLKLPAVPAKAFEALGNAVNTEVVKAIANSLLNRRHSSHGADVVPRRSAIPMLAGEHARALSIPAASRRDGCIPVRRATS